MESSHISLAHDHARAASVATHNTDTTVAINEHALAAGEFAKAAERTGSLEALRTLKLLEQHHQRLSDILKYPIDHPVPTSVAPEVETSSEKKITPSAAVSELRMTKTDDGSRPSASMKSSTRVTGQKVPRRLPSRDLTSSIASNLASARGIRTSHERRALSPSVSSQQAPGSVEVHSRTHPRLLKTESSLIDQPSGRPSWVPPVQADQTTAKVVKTHASATVTQAPTVDEGFSRFYSTFETLFSRISAPLAFAGLPLVSEEASKEDQPSGVQRRNKEEKLSGRGSTAAPDLSKYISRAALRASTHQAPGNDSFYVVPTTGHTVSYAGILSFAEKEKRRHAASAHSENPDLFDDPENDDEEFVDAREHNISNSAGFRKLLQTGGRGGKNLENIVEELYLENKYLRSMSDTLSKRLQIFEASSQSTSLALQESIRFLRPQSAGSSPILTATEPAAIIKTKLEEQLGIEVKSLSDELKQIKGSIEVDEKEKQRIIRENVKLNSLVNKYRDRWEKLKDGAKARREGQGAGKSSEGSGSRNPS